MLCRSPPYHRLIALAATAYFIAYRSHLLAVALPCAYYAFARDI